MPSILRRKLNALSGVFETADDQFDQLRAERLKYRNRVRNEISEEKGAFLQREIDFDNLTEFLNWCLPERRKSEREDISDLLPELKQFGYTRLAQLNRALKKAETAVKAYEVKYPPTDIETGEQCPYSQVGAVRAALVFTDDEYFAKRQSFKKINEFRSLIKN